MVEKANPTPEAYNAVVETAHLLDVKLISSEFTVKAPFFVEDKDDLKFVFGCDSGTKHYHSDGRRLIGMFHVEAGAKKSRRFLLKAKATYLIAFLVDGDPEEEAALAYVERVGAFGCWPYFRAHFATLCAGAGAEAPPLPIMTGNLPKKIS